MIFGGPTKIKIACFLMADKFQDEELMQNTGYASNKFHYYYYYHYHNYNIMYAST